MEHPVTARTSQVARFGRRKVAPRACIADNKPHIRKFLSEALGELGFVTCGCSHAAELNTALDEHASDLVILGLSAEGIDAGTVLQALAGRGFEGKVLLLAPRDSLMIASAEALCEQLGIDRLPTLRTPFDSESLRCCVTTILPRETPPSPVINASEALNAGWLEVWYQPKFSTHTLQMSGAEALIRVRHPSWGVVPPAYFLPDSDDPQLRALSEFVIHRVMSDWEGFIGQHPAVEIAINLPVSFLQNTDCIVGLCREMSNHPAFKGLIVEVDAADVVNNLHLLKAAAKQLRFGNIAISIDDVGSEWPSLVGLSDCPFAEIKVDRPLIVGCADDSLKRAACRQIIDLADSYGARTVAEGVETRADFFTVREMGFDVAQGFLLAKPMTAQKFAMTSSRYAANAPH